MESPAIFQVKTQAKFVPLKCLPDHPRHGPRVLVVVPREDRDGDDGPLAETPPASSSLSVAVAQEIEEIEGSSSPRP